IMKSKDFQNLVLSKHQNGDTPTKIYRDLKGGIGRGTVFRWCTMINKTGSIQLTHSQDHTRVIRTKTMVQKRLRRKKKVSIRKLAKNELDISRTSVCRILQTDLGLRAYKLRIEPPMTDLHKVKESNLQIELVTISTKNKH
ncbi:unnamed protein product, partial [Didymodactylos carnosus]